MQLQVVLAALVAAVLAAEEPITLDYHNQIGIPLAAKIKTYEEAAKLDGSALTGGLATALGYAPTPFIGGLVITLTDGKTSVCGSSVVTNNLVVTVAHCWRTNSSKARQFVVVLGSTKLFSGGTRITTTSVNVHPGYNPNNLENDIAIITIPWVDYSKNIRPIALPVGQVNNIFEGKSAQTAIFSASRNNLGIAIYRYQREVPFRVITNEVCAATYGNSVVSSSVICASSQNQRNICGVVSGGPLYVGNGNQQMLIGVTSFSPSSCRNIPVVFTSVDAYVPWIRDQMKTT